jgi:hypothetical protein
VIGLVVLVVVGSVVFFAQQNSPLSSSPYGGTLALSDPLKDNSQGYKWEETDDLIGDSCAFANGAYHVHVQQQELLYCTSKGTYFSNFAYQIKMTIIQGNQAGIIFRKDGFYYYGFSININGSYIIDEFNDLSSNTITSGSNDAIYKGSGVVNVLAVVANRSNITMFVNNRQIASIVNSAYSQGQIGIIAYYDGSVTEAVFHDAKVWML